MKARVIGIRESQSKATGGRAFSLSVAIPYSDYETKTSVMAAGEKVDNFYVTSIDCSVLKPGDFVSLEFEPGFQGKAQLIGIHLTK